MAVPAEETEDNEGDDEPPELVTRKKWRPPRSARADYDSEDDEDDDEPPGLLSRVYDSDEHSSSSEDSYYQDMWDMENDTDHDRDFDSDTDSSDSDDEPSDADEDDGPLHTPYNNPAKTATQLEAIPRNISKSRHTNACLLYHASV